MGLGIGLFRFGSLFEGVGGTVRFDSIRFVLAVSQIIVPAKRDADSGIRSSGAAIFGPSASSHREDDTDGADFRHLRANAHRHVSSSAQVHPTALRCPA